MTVVDFEKAVRLTDDLGRNDQVWFPKWIRRYALSFRGGSANLPVNRGSAIGFSRSLLSNGAPAWQRWQAVRAVDFYRKHILQRSEPDLTDVIQTLAQLGRKERNLPLEALPTDEELAKLRGNINRNEPIHIQTMRGEMRVLHYAMATERAYVRWVKRFSDHVGSTALEQKKRGFRMCTCRMRSPRNIPMRAKTLVGSGFFQLAKRDWINAVAKCGDITSAKSNSLKRSRRRNVMRVSTSWECRIHYVTVSPRIW